MARIFNDYVDENHLVVQKDGDGGAALFTTGIAIWLGHNELKEGFKKLEVAPGIWIRHPKPPWNAIDGKWCVSRDQMIGASLGMTGTQRVNLLINMRRWKTFQNLDLAMPHHWAHFYRLNFMSEKRYLIADVSLLIDTLIQVSKTYFSETFHDVINIWVLNETARIYPTWIGKISRWVLLKTRLGMRGHLQLYFSDESKAPPIAEIMIEKEMV